MGQLLRLRVSVWIKKLALWFPLSLFFVTPVPHSAPACEWQHLWLIAAHFKSLVSTCKSLDYKVKDCFNWGCIPGPYPPLLTCHVPPAHPKPFSVRREL